jgi:DNA-binding protein H-NS
MAQAKAAEIDVEQLSLDELKTLRRDIANAIESYESRRRREALKAAEAAAQEKGFSLRQLTGTAPKANGKAARSPKFRHPDNPELTWGGRGKRPNWLNDELADGRDLEEFRIAP